MRTIFILAAALAAAVSCSGEVSVADANSIAVKFAAEVVTRATDDLWESDDRVGIYMLTASSEDAYSECANVEYYNSSEDGRVATFDVCSSAELIYYPIGGESVDLLAYYPYSSKVGEDDFIYEVDLSDQSDIPSIDLMVADRLTSVAPSKSALSFTFRHVLSQLKVVVEQGAGSPSLDGVEVVVSGAATDGSYNIYSGEVSCGSSTGDMVMDGSVLLLPQTSNLKFTVTTAANEAGFTSDAKSITLDGGVITTVTLTLNTDGVSFAGDSIIEEWDDSGVNDEKVDLK